MGNEIIRGKLLSNDGELTLVVLALDPSAVKSDRLLGTIEAEARKIAVSRGTTAVQRMRNLVTSVEKAHYKLDRKLHELIEAAMIENWKIMREHTIA
jgi:predicted outer membrane protein